MSEISPGVDTLNSPRTDQVNIGVDGYIVRGQLIDEAYESSTYPPRELHRYRGIFTTTDEPQKDEAGRRVSSTLPRPIVDRLTISGGGGGGVNSQIQLNGGKVIEAFAPITGSSGLDAPDMTAEDWVHDGESIERYVQTVIDSLNKENVKGSQAYHLSYVLGEVRRRNEQQMTMAKQQKEERETELLQQASEKKLALEQEEIERRIALGRARKLDASVLPKTDSNQERRLPLSLNKFFKKDNS